MRIGVTMLETIVETIVEKCKKLKGLWYCRGLMQRSGKWKTVEARGG